MTLLAKDLERHSLATVLEQTSQAIRTAQRAEDYLSSPPKGRYGLTVEWNWGRGLHPEAYAAIRAKVQARVDFMLPEMIATAVQELLGEADDCKIIARERMIR